MLEFETSVLALLYGPMAHYALSKIKTLSVHVRNLMGLADRSIFINFHWC